MIAYICYLSVLPRSTKELTFSLQSNNGAGLCVVFQYNLNIKNIVCAAKHHHHHLHHHHQSRNISFPNQHLAIRLEQGRQEAGEGHQPT